VKVVVEEGTKPSAGAQVGFGYTPPRLHRFDAAGTRIGS
jgi:hypothetical protein